MFLRNFICPKCGAISLEADQVKTLESYALHDFDRESLILTLEGNPPKRPGYIIYSCLNPECQYSVKYSEEEILKKLLDDWTELAWKMAKHYAMHYYQFEDHQTRFLYDDKLQRFLKGSEEPSYSDTEELYREFYKFLKNDKKKYTK
jgi:hypothetical protein